MAFGLNQVNFIGRLGNNAEIINTKNGENMAKLSIAVDDSYVVKDTGERVDRVHWFNCVTFNPHFAKSLEKFAKKGRLVCITAKATNNTFQDADGNKKTAVDFVINELSYLDKNESSNEANEEENVAS